jgi:hypothetical protein
MGALAIKLLPEALRSLAFGSISGTYAGVGTPLANPSRLIMFQNTTDALLIVSFDGITDHLPVPANGFVLLDVTANKTVSQGFYIAEGTRFYVKEQSAPPSSGNFYISSFYGIDS